MKKIVLLSDGTGNGAAKRNKTNVWRLYSALDLHRNDQIAMYDDGVGSQEFVLFKIIGGAFGWGLKRNVINLYKFLCRNYQTDGTEGGSDKIYLFGFSRGSFTVRVLAGLIAECGLFTDDVPEPELDKKVRRNFSVYRNRFRRRQLSGLFARKLDGNDAHTTVRPKIEFIGVWDTVDAYGLPVDELMVLWDKCILPTRFPDQRLWDGVSKACHAISIDDERHTFHPVLWDESEEGDADRIEQVWFPGVHSDVGGGYPRDAFSLVSLDWMISKVEASKQYSSGLHFLAAVREEYSRRSDWHGTQHDSRAGLGAYYRYKPRNIELLCDDPDAEDTGVKPAVPKIHRSVFERIQGKVVPYAPTGLPVNYEIVATRGAIPAFENHAQKGARAAAMNGALDIIFWRRWVYRSFLAVTIALVSSRFILDWVADAPCTAVGCLWDPLLVFVRDLLPDFVAGSIEALRQHPMLLLAFAVLFPVLSVLKCRASAETLTRATTAWSVLKNSAHPPPWSPTGTAKLRELSRSELRRKFRWLWWAVVSALILSVIVLAAERVSFDIRDSMGWLCQPSDTTNPTTDRALIDFDAGDPCLATQVALVAGWTYRFDVQAERPWADGALPAGPDGLANRPSLAMRAFTPFLRQRSRPWFELTGRVGHSGREAFVIGSEACYTARSEGELFLYVNDAVFGFLPDPYWAWPYFWSAGRNSGQAVITVTPVGPSSTCERSDSCEASCPAQ